jgi:hypothetical protein
LHRDIPAARLSASRRCRAAACYLSNLHLEQARHPLHAALDALASSRHTYRLYSTINVLLHGPVANTRAWTRVRPVLTRAIIAVVRRLCQPHSLNAVMAIDELHPHISGPSLPSTYSACAQLLPFPASQQAPSDLTKRDFPPVIPAPAVRHSPLTQHAQSSHASHSPHSLPGYQAST